MQAKQTELGQIVVDICLNGSKGKAVRYQASFYDLLKTELTAGDQPSTSESAEDDKSNRQATVLRKTLRFCVKEQEIRLDDISASIDISKHRIINFLKNKNRNLLNIEEKRKLRCFLRKQMVS